MLPGEVKSPNERRIMMRRYIGRIFRWSTRAEWDVILTQVSYYWEIRSGLSSCSMFGFVAEKPTRFSTTSKRTRGGAGALPPGITLTACPELSTRRVAALCCCLDTLFSIVSGDSCTIWNYSPAWTRPTREARSSS
jgi:hypothetical protein